ncbi:hypothetical protein [Roseovarius phycicola]|uniref:DUF2125 domain-containing protein n=1 Tax=Roseovarius phycicola TaxID=3080976 RepID=A0ABZ2HIR8_9RHOB
MIRALILATLLGASSLAAQEARPPMTSDACLTGWQGFTLMTSMPGRLRAIQPSVTPTGWCRVDKSNGDLQDNDFASVEWRALGVKDAVASRGFPLDFEADFKGISLVKGFKMDLGPGNENAMGSLEVKAQRAPDSFDFVVEKLLFDFEDIGALAITASGGGIDLSSLERMQLTLGGMRIKSLGLSLDTTSDLSRSLRPVIEEVASLRDWVQILKRMPPEMFTDGSQEALMRFMRAMPAARGTLKLQVQSDNGIGILQIVGATMTLEKSGGRVWDIAAAVEQLVTGSTIDATWTP